MITGFNTDVTHDDRVAAAAQRLVRMKDGRLDAERAPVADAVPAAI